MATTKERETIFNIIFRKVCEEFKINRSKWNGKWDYSHYALYGVPSDNKMITDFMEDCFKESVSKEETIREKGTQLSLLSRLIAAECELYHIPKKDILIQGKYDDVSQLLISAYNLANTIKHFEYPKAFFDNKLLIPSECFVGREDLVQKVYSMLAKPYKKTKQKPIYLYGIGGIGKTEILKSIVNKILQTPMLQTDELFGIKSIYWLTFSNEVDTKETFQDNVIRLTNNKEKIDSVNRDDLYEKTIRKLLKNAETTLVVIDNVEMLTEDLLAFVNRMSCVRMIIAGRPYPNDYIKSQFFFEKVEELTKENCRELFRVYCPFEDSEIAYVDRIISLADRHTVSIELISKLVKKQEKKIEEFLQVLVECGFNFNFDKENEETVSSSHYLMKKESRIIEQLSKLFNTINLTDKERNLLIKFSTVPNIKCSTTNALEWFSLSNRNELISLSNSGWIKREESDGNKNIWFIHSIIAAAVRASHSDCLYDTCQPFIKKLTNVMQKSYEKGEKSLTMIIQFSWSVTDVFRDKFDSIEDVEFLRVLEQIYSDVGFLNRAMYINAIVLKITEKMLN